MTTDPDEPRREHLREDSDELTEAVAEIRRLEREKRRVEMSTPRFHSLADAIANGSRDVFRLAHHEQAQGNSLSGPQGGDIIEDDGRQAGPENA